MELYQAKNFCKAKETINRTKSPPIEREKIFANNISKKGANIHIQRIHITQHLENKPS